MGKFWLVVFALLFLVVAGGFVFLMAWDIPAPSQTVEKTLPDDMFPQ